MFEQQKGPLKYYIMNRQLTTLKESLTIPPWGKYKPSQQMINEWKLKTRNFAPVRARICIVILTYILCHLEIMIYLWLNPFEKLNLILNYKYFNNLKELYIITLLWIIMLFIFNRPIIWLIKILEKTIFLIIKKDILTDECSADLLFFRYYSILFYFG